MKYKKANLIKQELERQSREKLNTLSDIAKCSYAKKERCKNIISIIFFVIFSTIMGVFCLIYNTGDNTADTIGLFGGVLILVVGYGISVFLIIDCFKTNDDLAYRTIKKDLNFFSLNMINEKNDSYVKTQQKEILDKKHHEYYGYVNSVIDYANRNREMLTIKGNKEKVDNLIAQLFDRTINSIKRINSIDSEEWNVIRSFIARIKQEIETIVFKNKKIEEYYLSPAFLKIKTTCESMMNSQKEFNEYIGEKLETVSRLFGTRVIRNETINADEWDYIRPYKKTISPFAIEMSSAVFASAENNPLEYVAKYFYPNKLLLPEQIQKLYVLVEELETLREAKQIIENYKAEYQQYLGDVPEYIMSDDKDGFYSRLGFIDIDENTLTTEYKFSYTSGGGMVQRSFTVPMTEENIAELISILQGKLTAQAFAKEQRALMTRKLRDSIKQRDNFTCCKCGNSTFAEPNLLLEIDHIVPIAKGGCTEENNLQTLCWKCNRTKGDKLIF